MPLFFSGIGFLFLVVTVSDQGKADDESATLAELAVDADLAVEGGDHLLDISEAEAETFHVVAVAGRHAVEFLEYMFHIFLVDTDTVVGHPDFERRRVGVGCGDLELRVDIFPHIFESVVEEVENHVGKLELIDENVRFAGPEVGDELAPLLFNLELERVGHIGDSGVGIDLLKLEGRGGAVVEDRKLEHLLHLETEAFGASARRARW